MTVLLSLLLLLMSMSWLISSEKLISLPLIPHHVQRARRGLLDTDLSYLPRRRQLQKDTLIIGALYQGYGTHYVDLWVGSPNPQRQTVIVDTGSGVTAFPCSGCKDCGADYHIDAFFQESMSETFEKLSCNECTRGSCSHGECQIGMSYQEGSSWSAHEARDITYAGGPHDEPLVQNEDNGGDDVDPHHASAYAFPLKFGCQTKITGLFKTQLADGIYGMDSSTTAYWSQMHDAGKLKKRQFALCYSRQPTSTREGTEAGALTFGGPDTRLHTSPMVYSGGKKEGVGFFNVRIRKLYLREGGGGDSATSSNPNVQIKALDASEETLNRGRVIVDSGTTDTYFPRSIASDFNKVFKELTGTDYGHDAVDLSPEQLDALPTILLQLAGDEDYNKELYGNDASKTTGLAGTLDPDHPHDVLLAIPPSHYMEYDNKKSKYIARFYTDEGSGTVLGGNAIMGHDVYFDLETSRIGWAESKCDYTELVQMYDTSEQKPPATPEETPSTSEKEEKPKDSGEEQPADKSTDTKPSSEEPNVEEPVHEEDKHVDKPSEVDSDAKKSGSAPTQVCGAKCRGSLFAALLGVLFVGILVGRRLSSREVRYHGTELEVPTLHLDEDDAVDFSTRYRDNPGDDDEDDVAEEGAGYEDDDEIDPHEIA